MTGFIFMMIIMLVFMLVFIYLIPNEWIMFVFILMIISIFIFMRFGPMRSSMKKKMKHMGNIQNEHHSKAS